MQRARRRVAGRCRQCIGGRQTRHRVTGRRAGAAFADPSGEPCRGGRAPRAGEAYQCTDRGGRDAAGGGGDHAGAEERCGAGSEDRPGNRCRRRAVPWSTAKADGRPRIAGRRGRDPKAIGAPIGTSEKRGVRGRRSTTSAPRREGWTRGESAYVHRGRLGRANDSTSVEPGPIGRERGYQCTDRLCPDPKERRAVDRVGGSTAQRAKHGHHRRAVEWRPLRTDARTGPRGEPPRVRAAIGARIEGRLAAREEGRGIAAADRTSEVERFGCAGGSGSARRWRGLPGCARRSGLSKRLGRKADAGREGVISALIGAGGSRPAGDALPGEAGSRPAGRAGRAPEVPRPRRERWWTGSGPERGASAARTSRRAPNGDRAGARELSGSCGRGAGRGGFSSPRRPAVRRGGHAAEIGVAGRGDAVLVRAKDPGGPRPCGRAAMEERRGPAHRGTRSPVPAGPEVQRSAARGGAERGAPLPSGSGEGIVPSRQERRSRPIRHRPSVQPRGAWRSRVGRGPCAARPARVAPSGSRRGPSGPGGSVCRGRTGRRDPRSVGEAEARHRDGGSERPQPAGSLRKGCTAQERLSVH